jgi:hypothetical protein
LGLLPVAGPAVPARPFYQGSHQMLKKPLWLGPVPAVDKLPDPLDLVLGSAAKVLKPRRQRNLLTEGNLRRVLRVAQQTGVVERVEIGNNGTISLRLGEPSKGNGAVSAFDDTPERIIDQL